MSLRVRTATLADADSIGRIHVRSWQAAYQGVVPQAYLDGLDEDERTGEWRRILRGEVPVGDLPLPLNIVVELDGETIGFANIGAFRQPDAGSQTPRSDAERPGELWAMYVDPEHWGGGAGAALMDGTIAELQRKGYEPAYLWVLADNVRARRFYEKQGWSCDDVATSIEILGENIDEVRYSRSVTAE